MFFFFFSSRRRHTRYWRDWSSDVCSSDLFVYQVIKLNRHSDAHGKGMAIQFNYLIDKGAFIQNPDGTFAVNVEKFTQGVRELDHDLLTIEAEGDYAGAKKMQDELGVVRPVLRSALDNLQGIPTDIEPIFVTADEVVAPSKSQPDRKNHRRR